VAAVSSRTVAPAAAFAGVSICSTVLGALVWRALDREE
jgi:hypothetical protein